MITVRRNAFSTGFRFIYDLKHKEHEMFVKPKYKNLKEEIIQSGHLSLSKWNEFVDLKGRKWWRSKKVRQMIDDGMIRFYELTLEHLFAIILYCDLSVLCTEFSATYRRESVFETLESVLSRHSEFGNFGKLLVEMINKFGISRKKGNGAQQGESGPFYCGINRVLNLGTFAITLRGPCSTSTKSSVALNFADENGIILRLDNDSNGVDEQRFFDCSWISNYPGESERLWIGVLEDRPLRLESIVNVQTAKDYWKEMRALYLFDAMISGIDQRGFDKKQCEFDYQLISQLMKWTLNRTECTSSGVDAYFEREWDLFIQSKKQITLNLYLLRKCYPSLSKLAVYNLVRIAEYERNEPLNGNDNVLRPDLISIFPNVHTVYIDILYGRYKFRLEALLEPIQSISTSVKIIVVDKSGEIGSAATDQISTAFLKTGWNIECQEKGLIIKSKKR